MTGPEDCQTVAIVMEDPELKAQWVKGRTKWAREQRLAKQAARNAVQRETRQCESARQETGPAALKPRSTAKPTAKPYVLPSTGGLYTGTPQSW